MKPDNKQALLDSKLTSPAAQKEDKKEPWAAAKPQSSSALAAPTCPTLPAAKQVQTLTGAKPPAVSHDHWSCSQTLFAITAYSHKDAERPGQACPSGTLAPMGPLNPSRAGTPQAIPHCLSVLSWQPCPGRSRAGSHAQPHPKGKAF